MALNVKSLYNNNSSGANSATKKSGLNVQSLRDREFELKVNENKSIGSISYGAKQAIESNALDSYTPKDDTEKSVLDTYKKWTGYGKTYETVKAQYDKNKFGKGNIDLTNRPIFKNSNGAISTVDSIGISEDGKEIVIPTIIKDKNGNAKRLTDDEAVKRYHETGEYLGKFNTRDEADEYAQTLHIDQELYYSALPEMTAEEEQTLSKYGFNPTSFNNDDFKVWAEAHNFEYRMAGNDLTGTEYKWLPKAASKWNPWDTLTTDEEERDKKVLERFIEKKNLKANATNHPVFASAVTVVTAPYRGLAGAVATVKDGVSAAFGKDVNTYDTAHEIVDDANIIRETVTEEHASNWFDGASGKLGNYGALTYNGLMSIGDMVMTSLTTKGIGSGLGLSGKALAAFTSNATSGLLASTSGASTIMEKKKEGLSDDKAVLNGLAAAGSEFITEKISLDMIFKKPASMIKKGFISFLAEGSEEMTSDVLTKTADYFISGNDSAIKKSIENYMQSGMSKNDAIKQATQDSIYETLSAGLVGGFSGVAVSSAYHGFGRSEIKKTGADMRGVAADVIESGLDSPKNTNAYKYAEKLSKKDVDKITDYELGLQHIYNIEQIEYEQKKEEKAIKKAEKATRKTQIATSETADTAEQAPTNFPYNVFAEPQISVGDTFKDTKTGNTITVVKRDADSTSVEIDTGIKTETREVSNDLAENLVTSEQFEPIESAETTISADAVEKIIAGMTAEEKERHIGWIELKLSNGETNIDAEELAVYKALVAEKNKAHKNLTLTRVGDFYEAYGDEAVELANRLNLNLTSKVINGEKVQMVGFPVHALESFKKAYGDDYSISVSDAIAETNNQTVTEETTDGDTSLPEAFKRDENGKIRFNQVAVDYTNNQYREEAFNTLKQGGVAIETQKGGIIGKYGVHKKNNGYFGVNLLSSGMDIAAFENFEEALKFAAYTNENVSFNDVSYTRNAEGRLTIEATPEFMQYGEQIKNIKSEKAYLQTAKEAETSETVTSINSETVTSINSENMPVTDQNITDADTVTNTNVGKAEVVESVTEPTESVINSQKAEVSEAPVAVKDTTADVTTSLETKTAVPKTAETPADSDKTTAKTDKKVADKKSVAKKKKTATKQNKAKLQDFSDLPKVEDSIKEGQTLTLKHTKNAYSMFKDAERVMIGSDIISDGLVVIPYSEKALNGIKKVVDESVIQRSENFVLDKIYKDNNDVVVSGNPKISETTIKGKNEKIYVFKIGDNYYACQQKHLDVFNEDGNSFIANKEVNSPWVVKNEDGEFVGLIMPALKKGAMSDAIYDSLESVADVINAKNLKKAKLSQATLSQDEINFFSNGDRLISAEIDGIPFISNAYILLRTDNYTLDLVKEQAERDFTSPDNFEKQAKSMFSQDIVGEVTKTVDADIYETDYNGKVKINDKTGKPIISKRLTACLADDTPFCFDSKMFNILDKASDSLKIIRFTNNFEHSALIGFDENGDVTGYLCPVYGDTTKSIEVDGKQYKYYTKGSIDEKTADTAETDDLKSEEKSAIIEKDENVVSETEETISSVLEYTNGMKPMQKGKVEKKLNAPYQTKEYGLLTYADFMERSIADGRQLEERRDLKAKVRNGRNDFDFVKDVETSYNRNKAKYIAAGVNNFALAKEARELRENKTGGERIKSVDPELYYFLTGDESVLPESCFDKTYCVMVSDNEFYSVQKTAYDYGKWLEANGADASFSLDGTVEETKDLIAVHNVSPAKLLKTLKLGGFPMPSIAVARASDGFNQFGEISIVFDKNTIDPQASADNKIYGSDAWTPVYPSVEYEVDMDKAVGIYSRARKAGHLTFFNPVYLHQDTIENDINRYKGENGLVEHYKYDYGMKQFYLSEIGKPVDMVIGERTETLSEQEIEQAEFIAKELGKETILKIKTDSYTAQQWMQEFGQHYKNALFKYYRGRAKETVTDEQIWDIIDSKKAFQHSSDVQSVKNYIENGATRTETFEDSRATQEKIDSLVNQEEYEKWLADLFKGVVIKSGIRNNVDPYTEIGDRKSFDETHYAETLENVVRAMKEEEKQAGNSIMFSGTGLWGTAAKRYGSIDEVKSDSDRLVVWSEEKFSEVKRAIGGKLSDLADRIKSTTETNEFIARDDAIACILETISEAKTRAGMLKQLKSYYGLNQKTIDENVVQEIIDIVAEVQAMPTDYFEAKPQRAVGIDEIKAVIMPEQSSFEDDVSEIKSFFEEHNIPVLEYEYGDNNARIKALNSLDDVKFSKETEKGVLENETRNDATARSVGRSIGERADKSSGSLYETAGKAEENGGQRTDTASSRRIYAENVRNVQGTEVRRQGAFRCEFIKPDYYTDDMRAIEESNKKQGIKHTYFFFDSGEVAFKSSVKFRGAVTKNGDVYIQCNHSKYSPEQINKHEIVHHNYNTEDVKKVREYINDNLTEDEKRHIINVMYARYALVCKGDVNKVFEEFVCDVLSGINSYDGRFADISQEYWNEHTDLIDSYSAADYSGSVDAGGVSLSSQEYADTFYSKMAKEIDSIKQDKIGASSVVNYLKGRGVKDEEIKWSGIEEWLSDKKSVTKAELQEFAKNNMLQIDVETIQDDITIRYTQDELDELDRDRKLLDKAWEKANAIWNEAYGTDIPADILGSDDATSAMVRYVIDQHGGIRSFEGISHLSDAERKIYDDYSADSITRKIKDLEEHQAYIAERAKARRDNSKQTKHHKYTLDGGSGNYRELLFKIPESDYTNNAMSLHWDGRTGVVAHARVQDFVDTEGNKVLFVEEIQSDWHNEGAKSGYNDNTRKGFSDLTLGEYRMQSNGKPIAEVTDAYGNLYAYVIKVNDSRYYVDRSNNAHFGNFQSEEEAMKSLKKDAQSRAGVPDAPFRSTYHEFVLKNLLRMAAEQGYDKLAWTTGKMQENRWSSNFAEAYRIEYDQEIPKFLNKYGKKWGAKVGTTKFDGDAAAEAELAKAQKLLDDATEKNIIEDIRMWSHRVKELQKQASATVPAIDITDAMRESVLYEGQPMYSLNSGKDKIRYSSKGLRIPKAEYYKFSRAVGTDYHNKNKTHSGLQYQSVVGAKDHILYVYEDYGFDNYKIVGRVDYANAETANKVMELIDNGETIEIAELVSEVSEWLKARQGSYSIYNAYTKKRRSSRGVHSVSQRQSRSDTRGADGSGRRDAENGGTDDISFSLDEDGEFDLFDLWEQKNKEFGTIKKGENPARDIDVPKRITKDKLVSQFARTMLEAGVTPDTAISEFEKRVLDGTMTHEVVTNNSAREWAVNQIKYHGFEEALNTWNIYTRDGNVGKKELALGMELYNQCITSGDVTNAMKIAAELVAEATHAGQTLQATRMLKLMTPDGQLYYLEKSIQKMNDEFKKKIGDKYEDIELNEELMEKFLTEKEADKRDEIYDDICQDIADQIPATLLDKWNSWRYLAMLGNPRTHIRNIAGNAVFTPAIKLKNYIGAVIERVAKVDESKRTKSLRKSKEAVEFAKKDFSKMQKVLQGENAKYAVTSDIEGKRTIFKTKWLEALRNKNFEWLEKEDMWFLKKHYVDALAQIITARKLDVNNIDEKTLDIARAYATREAQRATYRDANALAEALNKLQKKASHSDKKAVRAANVLIEGVMPFKKTPLNIAKQGVQYSPVGILTGVYKTVAKAKNGDMYSTTDIIDDFAKGLTGTTIMLLGTLLASLGIISGGDDENKKKKEFDKMVGEQSFSLNIGDSSYTIDWMTPACLPLFTGVELYELTKDDFKFADIVNALSSLTDPLLELSVFSGISGAIESAQYNDTNTLFAIGSDMTTSYLTQALPTIGGQLSRIIDKNKREYYYTDKNSNLPKGVQNFIGQVSSKIPFASYLFEPSIDEWGREETYGGIVERTLENAISPGYYSEKNYTEVDEEIKRLYESTGEADVLPVTQQKKYTESKVDYPMTAAQWTEAKRIRGQKSFELIEQLFSDKMQVKLQNKETGKYQTMFYSLMSDEEKVRAIKKCYEDAGDYTKEQMLDKVKGNSNK